MFPVDTLKQVLSLILRTAGVAPTAGDVLSYQGSNQVEWVPQAGLGSDPYTQYALLAGRPGGGAAGQVLIGGTQAGDDLLFYSTSHGTKGHIALADNTLVVDETNSRVGIGTNSPIVSSKLDITSTTGALVVPRMTAAQRTALTAANGMIVYDTTNLAFYFYENGAWVTGSGLA
jgi:hypothetical protein